MTTNRVRWLGFSLFIILMYSSFLAANYLNLPPEEVSAGPGLFAPIITTLVSTGAVLLAFRSATKENRRVWMYLLVGVAMWAGADLLWGIMDLWGWMEDSYFSLADVLWLGGYLPVSAAFWFYLTPLHISFQNRWRIVALAAVCVLPLVTLGMLMADVVADPGENVWAKIVPILYPVLDVLLSGGGLLIAIATRRHPERWPWMMIGLAMVLFAFGDTWYALASFNGWYEEINWVRLSVDLPDTVANLTIALGATLSLQGVDEYIKVQRERSHYF